MKNLSKGFYSRGYLPHFDNSALIQFLTIRLTDTIPPLVIEQYKYSSKKEQVTFYEKFLDSGFGACHLRKLEVALIIQNSLLFLHTKSIFLHAWVIMPNHIHLLLQILQGYSLPREMKRFKSYTALMANRSLGVDGEFWMKDYFDRYIRDEEHYGKTLSYIEFNPVKAGLCKNIDEWRFSSAYLKS